jgi:hypothetical protein
VFGWVVLKVVPTKKLIQASLLTNVLFTIVMPPNVPLGMEVIVSDPLTSPEVVDV